MLEIPRDRFVPDSMAALAHLDRDLRLDGGTGAGELESRRPIKPAVLVRLIQAADPAVHKIARPGGWMRHRLLGGGAGPTCGGGGGT